MSALLKLEERLERIVGGAFVRIFPAQVQPVEIGAALQRECDNRATDWSTGSTVIPNDFTVVLSPADHEHLSAYGPELIADLVRSLRSYARRQRYGIAGPIAVRLEPGADLALGDLRIHAGVEIAPRGPHSTRRRSSAPGHSGG